MIGRLNHVAIAVKDIKAAAAVYRDTLGGDVTGEVPQPDHGVTTVFVNLPNTKIELLHPLGADSPIARFLERNRDGGMHHLCYEVDDIYDARDRLVEGGARVLGDGEPRIGAHNKPVLFLHPKDFCGTLIELEATTPFAEVAEHFDPTWHREGLQRVLRDRRALGLAIACPLICLALVAWLIWA